MKNNPIIPQMTKLISKIPPQNGRVITSNKENMQMDNKNENISNLINTC